MKITNIIKLIIICITLVFSINLKANQVYKIKIMGKIDGETVKLPNEGKFNMFQANAAFSDTDGNYGDAIGRGVRETDINNKVINIYAVLIFEAPDGSSMMARPRRTISDIKAGTGSYTVLYATGVFKKYLGYKCKYGISTTRSGAFVQENICKKISKLIL